ncbi:MAG: alpha/beta-hydrolase family protein, partial [Planctomycetota bacterium]
MAEARNHPLREAIDAAGWVNLFMFRRYLRSFSFVGLVWATLFFAASVTPSLIPRPPIVQGFLSGFALAIGYGVGVFLQFGWRFLELPLPPDAWQSKAKKSTAVIVALVLIACVWRATEWQNSIRELMNMPPVQSSGPYTFFFVAVVVSCALVALSRLCVRSGSRLAATLDRFMPRRISVSVSTLITVVAVLFIANGVVARGLLSLADRAFFSADKLIQSGIDQPTSDLVCGSAKSIVDWSTIGRRGKEFIVDGPTQDSIAEFTGEVAKKPIRVYVGMRTADDMAARAQLALDELKRVGGFDRKVLIVATPTGTGWLDEGAVDTVEYLHGGDTAIVSMQYSYLPSWMTILVDPSRAKRSAVALFDEIYRHWTTLPKDERPCLYVFGLSLGAFGSEEVADLMKTFQDPIGGAVWSGPPFPSSQWSEIVASREAGSTAWLPRYRDASMVRFTALENHLSDKDNQNATWGP